MRLRSIFLILLLLTLVGAAGYIGYTLYTEQQSPDDSSAYTPGQGNDCGTTCSSNSDCRSSTVCDTSLGRCVYPLCGNGIQCDNINGAPCTPRYSTNAIALQWNYPGYTQTASGSSLAWAGSIVQNGTPNCVIASGANAGQNPGPWVVRIWRGQPPANIIGSTTADAAQSYNWGPIPNIANVDSQPAPGEQISICCVEVESIDQGDMRAKQLGTCSTIITTETQEADISIDKSATPTSSTDGFFSYTVTVTNNGAEAATDLIITDVSDEILVDYIDESSVEVSAGDFTMGTASTGVNIAWTIPTLAAGASATMTYDVQIPMPVPASVTNNDALNTTIVYVDEDGDGTADPGEEQDRDTQTVTIGTPVSGVDKTATLLSQTATQAVVRYVISVTPDGESFNGSLIIVDAIDPKVQASWVSNISNSGQVGMFPCSAVTTAAPVCAQTIGWTGLSVNDGQTISVSYTVTIPAANFGTYNNIALGFDDNDGDDQPDPDEEIDRDDATITIVPGGGPNLPETGIEDYSMYIVAIGLMGIAAFAYKYGLGKDGIESILNLGVKGYTTVKDQTVNRPEVVRLRSKETYEKRVTERD